MAVRYPTGLVPSEADGVTQGIPSAIDLLPPSGCSLERRGPRGSVPWVLQSDPSWSGFPIGCFRIMAGFAFAGLPAISPNRQSPGLVLV